MLNAFNSKQYQKTRVGTIRSSLWTTPKELVERGNPSPLGDG